MLSQRKLSTSLLLLTFSTHLLIGMPARRPKASKPAMKTPSAFLSTPTSFGTQTPQESHLKTTLKKIMLEAQERSIKQTALHIAVEKGLDEVVTHFLEHNKELLNAKNYWGETALHIAARRGLEDLALNLVSAGAEADIYTCAGKSPLHLAASTGLKKLVIQLITHGVRIDVEDAFGHTPLSLAIKNNFLDIAKILEAEMAIPQLESDSESTEEYIDTEDATINAID